MLKWLRKYSRSWFIALAIGAIVVVFIFWGVGTMRSPRFQEVAEVNGTPILLTAYQRQFSELARQYQERNKTELTEETIKMLRLKEMALNRLIDETLLIQAGTQLGLSVTDAELREEIKSNPVFQRDGKFDEKRYFWVLSRNRISSADFEEQERKRLLLKKVVEKVTSFAKVSDLELAEAYRLSKDAVEVRYLEISPESFVAKQNPPEAEVAKFYQDHQAVFRLPARARVNYLLFRTNDFLDRVQVSKEEVENYLGEHHEQFTRPKVIRVSQILLKLPPKATAADKQRVEKQAQELLNQAAQGEDFTGLARAHSQDEASKAKGGDLGYVSRGQHPPEWDQAAFALKVGSVGQASTPQGIFLIKLEEVKETERLPDADAQASRLLKSQKARARAREVAQEARGAWSGGVAVADLAKKYGATVQETPLMALKDAVPGLGAVPAFNQTALELKEAEISKVVDLPDGFAVLKGMEHQAEQVPPLEKIRDQVRDRVKKELAKNQAEEEAKRWLSQLTSGKSLEQVASQAGLKIKDSGYFTRFQGFLNQPNAQDAIAAAFQLSPQKPYPSLPLFLKNNYYLIAFKGRRGSDQAEFQKDLDQIRAQFLMQKSQMLFASWLENERKRAKIKVYELSLN